MGGDLTLDSAPGIGTTFFFRASFAADAAAQAPTQPVLDGIGDRPVLIVEDTHSSRELLETLPERLVGAVRVGDHRGGSVVAPRPAERPARRPTVWRGRARLEAAWPERARGRRPNPCAR